MSRRRGSLLGALRGFVHLRYVRAIVAAVSLVAIVGSGAALILAVRHDVSAGAVVRYFVRQHSDTADLGRLLRSGSTVFRLEPLLTLPPGVNPGGLVYEEEHGLVFYIHTPHRQEDLVREFQARRELFELLAPHYWRADLDALARVLNRPAMRQELLDRGALIQDLYAFQRYNGKPVDGRARTDLLRRAARQMQLVAPYIQEPMTLGFEEQLQFYDHHHPQGRFVGRWEVAAPNPFAILDTDHAHELSATNHYIVLSRFGERTRISDFYRGARRDYQVVPIDLASGRTFYRLSAQPAL